MNEAKGHICPECGAPRGADGSPSCACTQRASDALRDTRTAEAAAAEDFDPLRIRPYVDLEAEPVPEGAVPFEDETQRLPAVEATMPLRAVVPAPSATDLSLFEGGGDTPEPLTDAGPPRRPRRTLVLTVAGAVVAVLAAAGFASGLFSYETPSRDDATPQDVRASVPAASKSAARVTPSTSGSPSAQPTSASPTPSLSTNPSPSASSSPSATASRSTAPARTPTATATTPTATAGNGQSSSPAPILRRGDDGPEVTELQLRLTQLNFYSGPHNGIYDKQVEASVRSYQWARGIQTDELGVYGAATRAKLESETTEP